MGDGAIVSVVAFAEAVTAAEGRRMEGEGSRPLRVRLGRASVRVCTMYYCLCQRVRGEG